MNKVLKVYAELDQSQDCGLPFFGPNSLTSILFELQKNVRSLKNRTMRMCYDYDQAKSDYIQYIEDCKRKIEMEHFPTVEPRDFSNKNNFTTYLYDLQKTDYPLMNTRILGTITKQIAGDYKKDKEKILTGEKSLRTYKEGQPINVRASDTTIFRQDDLYYVIKVSLFSNEGLKRVGMKKGGCRFILHDQTDSERAILDRILSGEYKLAETKLAYDHRKNHYTKKPRGWYFCIGYSFEKSADLPALDPDKILGVDIGIANVLYLGWSEDDHFKFYIPGSEIRKFQATEERRKRDILRCSVARGQGSRGHGRKCATRKAEEHEHHIHNFKETKNWNYAHFVVDHAVEYGFGTIQMEDLKGISKSETFDRTWTFYSLQQKIEQLAEERGIRVQTIDPQYTSQMCSKCGYISSENRKNQSDFRCVACGYRKHADHNAAMNISKKNIEALVKAQIKKQGNIL